MILDKSMLESLVIQFYGDKELIDQFIDVIIDFNKNYNKVKLFL